VSANRPKRDWIKNGSHQAKAAGRRENRREGRDWIEKVKELRRGSKRVMLSILCKVQEPLVLVASSLKTSDG
jgi:hypothetical protein